MAHGYLRGLAGDDEVVADLLAVFLCTVLLSIRSGSGVEGLHMVVAVHGHAVQDVVGVLGGHVRHGRSADELVLHAACRGLGQAVAVAGCDGVVADAEIVGGVYFNGVAVVGVVHRHASNVYLQTAELDFECRDILLGVRDGTQQLKAATQQGQAHDSAVQGDRFFIVVGYFGLAEEVQSQCAAGMYPESYFRLSRYALALW